GRRGRRTGWAGRAARRREAGAEQPAPRPSGREARLVLRRHTGRRARAPAGTGVGPGARTRDPDGGLLEVRVGGADRPGRVRDPALPRGCLAAGADVRPVDDLPGVSSPRLDQCVPGQVTSLLGATVSSTVS